MALSDLAVFNEYAYQSVTEILDQKIDELIGSTNGAIVISNAAPQGDFNESSFFALIGGGLVRRRNAYADGPVSEKSLSMLVDREVKVASGTPPVRIDPHVMQWIQLDPKLAGATIARQLAPDMLADLLNTGMGVAKVALATETEVVKDITTEADPDNLINFSALTRAASLFGDRASDIGVWVMHSAPMHGMYLGNLMNAENLFNFSTVNVTRDPFGRLIITTDSPALVDVNGADLDYSVLGLTTAAISITRNNDWLANEESTNGYENIRKTYQAQWSNNYSLKGFAWDKTSGGKSPNDAALLSGANWDRVATSHKDLAGVLLKGRART